MPDHEDVQRFYGQEYYGHEHGASRVPWRMRKVASRLGPLSGKCALKEMLWVAKPAGGDVPGPRSEWRVSYAKVGGEWRYRPSGNTRNRATDCGVDSDA